MFGKTFSYPKHEIIRQVRDSRGRKFKQDRRLLSNKVVLVQAITPFGTLILNLEAHSKEVTVVNGELKHRCCKNVFTVNTDNYAAYCKKCKRLVSYYSPGEITLYEPYVDSAQGPFTSNTVHGRLGPGMNEAKHEWITAEDGIEKFYLEEVFERELETFINDCNATLRGEK